MPISGYDPDDVDDALESRLDERDAREFLDDAELAAYREGDRLVDLLDEAAIHALLGGDDRESGDGGGSEERDGGSAERDGG